MAYQPMALMFMACILTIAFRTEYVSAFRQNLNSLKLDASNQSSSDSDTSGDDALDNDMLAEADTMISGFAGSSLDGPQWSAVEANAFNHKFLAGFHLTQMAVDASLTHAGAGKWTPPKNGNLFGTLVLLDEQYTTSPAVKCTRLELVPKVTAQHAAQTGAVNIPATVGAPAQYFAYVRFGKTGANSNVNLRLGGFIYFASLAHLQAGWPMSVLNILSKSEAGTMRFARGYTTFWQLGNPIPAKGHINFEPRVNKQLSTKHSLWKRGGEARLSFMIPKVDTYKWFGEVYAGAPGADEVEIDFSTNTCKHVARGKTMPLRFVRSGLESVLGAPGDPKSRWSEITLPEFQQVGARHYAWVMPGELGDGGFIYSVVGAGGEYHNIYFEMLSNLCGELQATAYDTWISSYTGGSLYPPMRAIVQRVTKPLTLVFVIDMQNDFVGMSFQMPCQRKREDLAAGLVGFLKKQFTDGATIVGSLDWHPQGHCGVLGNCVNQHGPFKDDNRSFYASGGSEGRYVNRFPPHCEWTVGAGGRSVPTEGAKYYRPIGAALHEMASLQNDRVHTVFKGFNPSFDSFSAMPTYTTEDAKDLGEDFTGGFAMSGAAAYTPWPATCYGPDPEKQDPPCFPTAAQLAAPRKPGSFMFPVQSIVESKPFERIIVTGLVWDFCVKETAFNVKKLFPGKQVVIPVELSRPACEGGPLPADIYPPAGLGTPEIMARTGAEYLARDIALVSVADIK